MINHHYISRYLYCKMQSSKSKRKRRSDREIKIQQNSVKLLIPAAPFRRLVDEFTVDTDIRYQRDAISALQTATEDYLIGMFQDGNVVAGYCGRETLHSGDISLALELNK